MATQPAIVGALRVANARLGYNPTALAQLRATRIRVYVNGVLANDRVRRADLTIRDVINETPSVCSFTADTTAPTVSQAVRITINSDTPRLLFNGAIQTVDTTYDGDRKTNLAYPVSATDDLERLKRRTPFGQFTDSATTVVQTLAASFAPGFTTTNVAAGLPDVAIKLDGSEGWDGALKQIAGLIGGYYYIEDGDIHLFLSESTDLPDAITGTTAPAVTPAVSIAQNVTQVRTRVYGKGMGATIPTGLAIGETIVPVDTLAPFNALGGTAIADTQRLTYTATQAVPNFYGYYPAGSLVGPGSSPSVAPDAIQKAGSGLGVGLNEYVYTFITGSGESIGSPVGSVTTYAHMPAPVTAPSPIQFTVGSRLAAGWYAWAVTFLDATGETTPGPRVVVQAAYACDSVHVWDIPVGPLGTTSRGFYRSKVQSTSGGADVATLYRSAGVIGNNTTTDRVDSELDVNLVTAAPGSNTTDAYQQATVSGIAVGPTGVTNRKLYRRRIGVNADLFHLLDVAGLGDNTTTTYIDSVADGTIAANVGVPGSDTSGLTPATGQVLAGATSIETVNSLPFTSGGTSGWAQIGQQLIRYTGITGNTLTGIPASGSGALVSTVRYGEHIDPVPSLIGVSGIVVDMPPGTPINLWVQRDDVAAQAAMAAMDGGDGIYEFLVSDERRAETSLTALCDAHLALYSRPLVTVKYATRDVKTKSGKPVTFTNILGYSGTLTIQDVQIAEIDVAPGTAPKFTATASSVRVSLEAMLRQLMGEA